MSNVLDTAQTMDNTANRREFEGAWATICPESRFEPERGVAALLDSHPIAIFRIDDADESRFYAVDHIDPKTQTPTIARGIVGSANGTPIVAAPLLKQRYDLVTGECLSDSDLELATYAVRVHEGLVQVRRNVILGKQS